MEPNGVWFLYVVCNKHFNKPAKNQTLSRAFPEFMAKKRSLGPGPNIFKDRIFYFSGPYIFQSHRHFSYERTFDSLDLKDFDQSFMSKECTSFSERLRILYQKDCRIL